MGNTRGSVIAFQQSLQLSAEDWNAFRAAVKDAQTAKSFEDQADAMARVDALLQKSAINGGALSNKVTDTALAMREAETQSEQATGAMNKMPGALAAATGSANGLAGAMGKVSMAANATLSLMIQMDATRRATQGRAQATAAGFVGRPEQSDDDMVAARAAVNRAKAQIIAKANAEALAGANGSGGGATKQATDEVQAYIDKLQVEQDVMATTDPVQQEMLKNRKLLADASVEQRMAIEELLTAQQKEANLTDAMKAFGQATYDALSGLIIEGKSASDVMKGLEKAILQAALQALVLGEGPLAGIFGTKGTSLISLIFGGKKADGGMIYGAGGARDDKVMIAASAGEYIVNGRAANANRPLLDYINGGGRVGGYASGGTVAARGDGSGGGSGGGSGTGAGAVVSMPIHIDARGAQAGVAEQIAAKFQEMAPQISQIAVSAVAQARGRGYLA